MITSRRYRKASILGLTQRIGMRVKIPQSLTIRGGEMAEIVGWGFNASDDKPVYYIRFENGECDMISSEALEKKQAR